MFTVKEKATLAVQLAGDVYKLFQEDGTAVKYDNWKDGIAIECRSIIQAIEDVYMDDYKQESLDNGDRLIVYYSAQ